MTRSRSALLSFALAAVAAASLLASPAASAETSYTFADVQRHGTSSDCWAVVSGGVYNLTSFIGRHEGGPGPIIAMCGLDGTVSYLKQHPARSGENEPASALRHYRIGILDPTSIPSASAATYTLAQIAKHDTAIDCWSAVGGKVYNLTNWGAKHPGGAAVITAMCGLDGSASYDGKHGGSLTAAAYLAQFVIGTLDPTAPAATAATYTSADVAAHGSATNCWSTVSGSVYDLTKWIGRHPGGPDVIKAMCGSDGTALYEGQHKGSKSANAALAQFKVGSLGTTGTTPATAKTYTLKQVRRHGTAARCWSVVNGRVYNLTKWIARHPGGRGTIVGMCGRNGSKAFNSQHRGSATAAAALKSFRIGRLA